MGWARTQGKIAGAKRFGYRAQESERQMNKRWKRHEENPSRRDFLKSAGIAASAAMAGKPLWASRALAATGNHNAALSKIDARWMITPKQAWEWATFKSEGGPTYAGSSGWKRYTDFLISRMQEFGSVDLDSVEIPYDRYIVEDWPDRKTHIYDSGVAIEKLVSGGTPVPVVASYGMTSGFTPAEGITAPMLFYDPAHPPADAQVTGKILVFQTPPYLNAPYPDSFLNSFTPTDYEWRSPGKWPPLFTPTLASETSSYHTRWAWSQLNHFAEIGIKGRAAGMVVVYDLSPGAAFGLTQRSVYTPKRKSGIGGQLRELPTLTLDRVNGAKVLADAKAGKTATLTLRAHFERSTAKPSSRYLPGKNYGTPLDEQVLLATHTDAMSLVEEMAAWECWESWGISIRFRG